MSKLSGVVLILAGLGVGVYALPSRDDTAPEAAPPQQGGLKATPALSLSKGLSPELAEGAKGADGAGPSGPLVVRQAHHEAAFAGAQTPVTRPQPVPVQATLPPVPPAAKAISPPGGRVAETPTRVPVGQYTPAAGPPLDRPGLTRELQRQLKRVGCYDGEINGVWTPSARRSMKAFTDRVNATLPIEQPDYILLAMVQNHQAQACGRSCPPGQGLAGDGRCLPNALIARGAKMMPAPGAAPAPHAASLAAKTSPPAHNSPAAAPAPPVPAPSSADRMALAGPPAEPLPSAANDPARIAPANPLPAEAEAAAQQAPPVKSTRQPGHPDTRERRRLRAWGQGGAAANRFPAWAVPHAMP